MRIFRQISVKCIKLGIRPVALTIMMNHFHKETPFKTEKEMESLMNGICSTFARAYNAHYRLSGSLFKKGFNRSSKNGDKKVRDTFIYIGNNGKEKIPSIRAEDYKWNFIKYLESDHPFSERIDYNSASPSLLQLLSTVLARRSKLKPLRYDFFDKEFYSLTEKERLQLTDFLVIAYFCLDKEKILSLYGDYDSLCTAMNAVTGSEHDFSDDWSKENYLHYYQMIRICKRLGYDVTKYRLRKDNAPSPSSFGKTRKDNAFPASTFRHIQDKEFNRLVAAIRTEVNVTDHELAKFFHLLD